MLIGEVIGNVWATKKYEGLEGQKISDHKDKKKKKEW